MAYKTERQILSSTILKDYNYKTTKDVFERVANFYPDRPILAELDKDKNIVYHTANEVYNIFCAIGAGLIINGCENKHIAIMSSNCCLYVLTDLAIASGVGVVIPIDKDASVDLAISLLTRCDADIIIASSDILPKIKEIQTKCPNIKKVIVMDKDVDGYLSMNDIIEMGQNSDTIDYFINKNIDINATCEILYTSGTTGLNKPVAINQKNLIANIMNCLDTIKAEEKNNTSMSILPMHHATEINTHIMPRIAAGRLTYINGSMKDMMNNIKIFKPYVITIVPMVANAFYKNIWANAKKVGKDEKLKKGIKLCKITSKFGVDLTHKLFKDIYTPFGGNLKQIVCGGAPLNPEVVAGLRDIGIFIINGFGITECGPLVSMNTETNREVFSIGRACPNLSIKVCDKDEDDIGELCIKGDSVSCGYYNDIDATNQVYDTDGYFHTGDLVKINSNDMIFLAGRKKNLIVLDNGKNVFPEELEQVIVNNLRYIKDVFVFEGEYVRNGQKVKSICAEFNFEDDTSVDASKLKLDFQEINRQLPTYKRIAYAELINGEFEKNASKKIIRKSALQLHDENNGIIL